jgi:hypothetical protein
MVAVMPSSVWVTVVGGCAGIAAPGICAADRGEFTHDKKSRIRIVAQQLARAGKTVVFDILVRPSFQMDSQGCIADLQQVSGV